eukprot:SAG11_NODE_600_length_8259_cov_6.574510_6_plen_84_part_00
MSDPSVTKRIRVLASFMPNIPAKFEFECTLHEAKADGNMLTPANLDANHGLGEPFWRCTTVAQMDPMFWTSKQHLHMVLLQDM